MLSLFNCLQRMLVDFDACLMSKGNYYFSFSILLKVCTAARNVQIMKSGQFLRIFNVLHGID